MTLDSALAARPDFAIPVVSEVIAHGNENERRAIFRLFKRLLNVQGETKGHCTMPFDWLLEQQAKAYQKDPANFNWRALDIALRAGDEEIAREEFVHTLSEQTRKDMEQWDSDFEKIFKRARPAFEKIFNTDKQRPSVEAVAGKLLGEGGAHLEIGADLIERATNRRPTEQETMDFMERCPSFKALLYALCVAQYDRCIRAERQEWIGKAGRVDMFSAAYLPYCSAYVTNDKGQAKALAKVVELAGLETEVKKYEVFKEQLFGI